MRLLFPMLFAKAEEFIKWLGLFAYDPDKRMPSAKSGIGLMGATTLCLATLWIVFRAPYVPGYMNIVVEVLIVVASSTGLSYAVVRGIDQAAKVKGGAKTPPDDTPTPPQ